MKGWAEMDRNSRVRCLVGWVSFRETIDVINYLSSWSWSCISFVSFFNNHRNSVLRLVFLLPVAFIVILQKFLHHVLHSHKPARHGLVDQRRVRPEQRKKHFWTETIFWIGKCHYNPIINLVIAVNNTIITCIGTVLLTVLLTNDNTISRMNAINSNNVINKVLTLV